MDRTRIEAALQAGIERHRAGDLAAAVRHLLGAIELDPTEARAWLELAKVYESAGNFGGMLEAYRQGAAAAPANAQLQYEFGFYLCWQGKLDAGIAQFKRALQLQSNPDWHGHLLYMLLYHPSLGMDEIFREHLAWAKRYAGPITARAAVAHANSRDPDRRLRVGYVSPHFHRHAVSFFTEPMLAAHDRSQVEIFCYSDGEKGDEVTQRLKTAADQWRDVREMEDEQLASLVRQDGIDILVDLAGHLSNNRLLTFAQKPAPVQVTYLGYQASTGMSAMNYRLTDAFADPPGSEKFYTERLIRLPLFFVYRPLDDSPGVSELPAMRNGFITFGSMNALIKANDQVIAAWAQVLARVPASRLIVLVPGGEQDVANDTSEIRRRFAAAGIDASRVMLVSRAEQRGYLDYFSRMDIALDPFPFGGHTTTCDALWMGVPTVVLAGEHYVSRMGVSVMTAIGATEWIANSKDEYVVKLVALANDTTRLAETRSRLRQRLQTSDAMNAQLFTRNLEAAYREMWLSWLDQDSHH